MTSVFEIESGRLPRKLARVIVDVVFREHDEARIYDLAVGNQADALSA